MLGDNLNNHQQNFTIQLFADWLNPSTGRRSRSQSKAFLQEFQNASNNNMATGLIDKIINVSDVKVEEDFQKEFMFGKSMQIWRKGKVKSVEIFLDPSLPTLLWVSSKTKAFLFDLTYTTVHRFDLQLQKSSKIKDYVVLHYFQQQLPIVFRGQNAYQAQRYYNLFNDYVIYNNLMRVHPPFFSRIMKLYTMEAIKDNFSRKKKASDILKVSQTIGLVQKSRNLKILQAVNSKFNNQGLTDNTGISHDTIGDYFKIVHCCEEMKPIYQKYANFKLDNYNHYLSPIMTKEAFRQFLILDQQQQEKIISQIVQQTKQKISFYDFCCYLMSQKTNYAVISEQIDENYPLTDYFCYSSHNTYLSGNQLTSDSKIERYIEDLQGGLKCVQIDVHNDGGRPIITHAINDKSLCKEIDFQETIQAINKFSNHHPNHYPIILSVQNHASDANRYKMLNILLRTFDKKLLRVNNEDPHQSLQVCNSFQKQIISKQI